MSYFTIQDAEQFTFFRIPKVLFTGERYKDMTTDARVLYGILLDRVSLSVKNNWVDKKGRVFIIFTREEVQELLGFGNQKVVKLFKELCKVELIEETKQGLNKPNIIYVKKFIEENNAQSKLNQRKCENHTSRNMKITLQEVGKSHAINTNINNTYKNDIDNSVNQSREEKPKKEKQPIRTTTDRQTEFENIKLYFKDKLYLDDLKISHKFDTKLIEEIELNILEMYFNDYTTIKGERKPREIVRSALMKLNIWHIEELISKYKGLTIKITNPKAYMQTMIYNIAFENDLSVTNAVQHDMSIGY
ncbi:MAG: replication initiator protein A [Candidatus Alkaliphilus sp. MAG34]